jgi:hypothetical protein
MVLEIEEDYNKILMDFEGNLLDNADRERQYYGFKQISEQVLLGLLRNIMNFQRKIEYSIETTLKLFSKTGYAERLKKIGNDLFDRLCNDKKTFDYLPFPYSDHLSVYGVIPLLKLAHNQLLKNDYMHSRRNCFGAYHGLRLLKSSLIELEEELRLIGALTTYPIEKKTILKNRLVANDFEQVAVSLEEAETNAESEHFKDCVSRCRDAVEILIASIREKETGEKTEKHFAADLGKIAKIEVFDEATQKLAQGVYSFLSLKGSHKYDAAKVTVYDAETSLKETYSLIEMLLKKLSDYKKSKEK